MGHLVPGKGAIKHAFSLKTSVRKNVLSVFSFLLLPLLLVENFHSNGTNILFFGFHFVESFNFLWKIRLFYSSVIDSYQTEPNREPKREIEKEEKKNGPKAIPFPEWTELIKSEDYESFITEVWIKHTTNNLEPIYNIVGKKGEKLPNRLVSFRPFIIGSLVAFQIVMRIPM